MHRSCVIGLRVAALPAILAIAQLVTWSNGQATTETVYAIEATPSPVLPAGAAAVQMTATPTPVGTPSPATGAAPASALQQTGDQIASVSQQVAQTVQDPSISVDAKVQLINSLAALFNQLVAQWQQQVAQTAAIGTASAPPGAVSAPTGPTPAATAAVSAANAGIVSAPANISAPATGGQTADQLRAQLSSLSQQIVKVSQDPSLSPEARAAQVAALNAQYTQLMTQLQQLGG